MRKSLQISLLILLFSVAGSAQTRTANTHPFAFRSGFWINLHHFLYEQALLRSQSKTPSSEQLSSQQQQQWNAALDYYATNLIKRDFVRDEGMIKMNDQLGDADNAPDLNKSGVEAQLVKVLESVAPLYRARWWPQHDKANRFWITVATPLAEHFSQILSKELSAAFKAKFASAPIRVDVVEYANWAGAFTTFSEGDKVHITICSVEPGNQGFAALELLFHEASHWMVGPRQGAVAEGIAREARAKNKPIPRDLWHALLFYTVGEITKRNLRAHGVSNYTPMVYLGLFTRAWPNFQKPLEIHWQPYLDGKVDFDTAMSDLIGAL